MHWARSSRMRMMGVGSRTYLLDSQGGSRSRYSKRGWHETPDEVEEQACRLMLVGQLGTVVAKVMVVDEGHAYTDIARSGTAGMA